MFMDTHSHPGQNVQLFIHFDVIPYGSYGILPLEQMQMLPAVILEHLEDSKFPTPDVPKCVFQLYRIPLLKH